MYRSISSLIPDVADLLTLEVEELAGVLLTHLNSRVDAEGSISQSAFFGSLRPGPYNANPEYGDRQSEANRALMEAWTWLQSEAFLVRDPAPGPDWFFISRRGRRLETPGQFESYRKASLLPRGRLHPAIASRVYPAFLRGDYDTAVFQSFREIEVSVRQAGEFPHELVGEKLIRAAFKPAKNGPGGGPLTDPQLPAAEQLAMSNLFAGAFGLYRNPAGHRYVPTDPTDAADVIVFASQLLRIVDRLKPITPGVVGVLRE